MSASTGAVAAAALVQHFVPKLANLKSYSPLIYVGIQCVRVPSQTTHERKLSEIEKKRNFLDTKH